MTMKKLKKFKNKFDRLCCDQNHQGEHRQLIKYQPKLLTTWSFKKPEITTINCKLSKKHEKERTLYQNTGDTTNQYRGNTE